MITLEKEIKPAENASSQQSFYAHQRELSRVMNEKGWLAAQNARSAQSNTFHFDIDKEKLVLPPLHL